jgi:hypothetical protein
VGDVFIGENYMSLDKLPSGRYDKPPKKIVLPLDTAIVKLKSMKNELPSNFFSLSSRHVFLIETMMAIINGLDIPEKIDDNIPN